MYPHERSLVKRFAGQPFALVGVNSDTNLGQLKTVLKDENISWRSFTNGPNGTGGPISRAWEIQGWPTLFVIDHKGVVRHKYVGSPGDKVLDDTIEKLVEEVEKGSRGQR